MNIVSMVDRVAMCTVSSMAAKMAFQVLNSGGHMRAPRFWIWLGASHTQGQKMSMSRTAQTIAIRVTR